MFKITRMHVAVVGALASFGANAANVGVTSNFWYTPTLANNLIAQGHTVSVVNSYTAASLSSFDAFIQDGNGHFDNAALDSFVFQGGTLIQLPWSLGQNYSYSGALNLIGNPTNITYGSPNPGVTVLNSSYLLNGVTLPAANAHTIGYEIGTSFTGTGNSILQWNDGSAMLADNSYGAGKVVAFNLHMITSDSNPLNAAWSNQIVYNAIGTVGPIPEPETYAMMLAGLGMLGFMARRRKLKAAA
jgi:hypothetical protein